MPRRRYGGPVNKDSTAINSPARARPSLREIHRTATREHLVAAARTVFERDGYFSATVEDIIHESGASRATFYAHFGGKAELIDAVIAGMADEVDSVWYLFREAVLNDTKEDLRRWALAAIEFYNRHSRLVPVFEQVHAAEKGRSAHSERFYDNLTTLVQPYLECFPESERERMALRFRILAVQITTLFFRLPIDQTTPEMRDMIADELTGLWFPALSLSANGASPPRR